MDPVALHREVRSAHSLSDELARHEHALGDDTLAGDFGALRSLLARLEVNVGRSHARRIAAGATLLCKLERMIGKVRHATTKVPKELRPRLTTLIATLDRVVQAERFPAARVRAKPILGVFPLARVIPDDVHVAVGWLANLAFAVSARVARTRRARGVGVVLSAVGSAGALFGDEARAPARLVSIERRESVDHGAGAAAILAPFVLGYVREDRIAATIQIAAGFAVLATSLLTDYRAVRGLGGGVRSNGGPKQIRARVEVPVLG